MLLTQRETAEILRVDERTVRRYTRAGMLVPCRLPSVEPGRVGKSIRYERAEVERFIAECRAVED